VTLRAIFGPFLMAERAMLPDTEYSSEISSLLSLNEKSGYN
jgi:hypothetical protein